MPHRFRSAVFTSSGFEAVLFAVATDFANAIVGFAKGYDDKGTGGIAQLVERLVRNEKVRGSTPLTSTSQSYSYSSICKNFNFALQAAFGFFSGCSISRS